MTSFPTVPTARFHVNKVVGAANRRRRKRILCWRKAFSVLKSFGTALQGLLIFRTRSKTFATEQLHHLNAKRTQAKMICFRTSGARDMLICIQWKEAFV
jgi:hypothetical protein